MVWLSGVWPRAAEGICPGVRQERVALEGWTGTAMLACTVTAGIAVAGNPPCGDTARAGFAGVFCAGSADELCRQKHCRAVSLSLRWGFSWARKVLKIPSLTDILPLAAVFSVRPGLRQSCDVTRVSWLPGPWAPIPISRLATARQTKPAVWPPPHGLPVTVGRV